MIPRKVFAKFGLCSICLQNVDGCSVGVARKMFTIVRMLGFSLNFLDCSKFCDHVTKFYDSFFV